MEPTHPYWLNDAPYQDFRSTPELPARFLKGTSEAYRAPGERA